MKKFIIIIEASHPDFLVDCLENIKQLIVSDSDYEKGADEGEGGSFQFTSNGEYD